MALVVDETAKVQQEDQRLCGLSTDVFVFDSSSAILKMEWRDLMAGERVTHTAHVQPFFRSVDRSVVFTQKQATWNGLLLSRSGVTQIFLEFASRRPGLSTPCEILSYPKSQTVFINCTLICFFLLSVSLKSRMSFLVRQSKMFTTLASFYRCLAVF